MWVCVGVCGWVRRRRGCWTIETEKSFPGCVCTLVCSYVQDVQTFEDDWSVLLRSLSSCGLFIHGDFGRDSPVLAPAGVGGTHSLPATPQSLSCALMHKPTTYSILQHTRETLIHEKADKISFHLIASKVKTNCVLNDHAWHTYESWHCRKRCASAWYSCYCTRTSTRNQQAHDV